MMKNISYYELLKHPQWQKKRLEVLQHADFECEYCGTNKKTLHVHHAYYEKGLKPWEYPEQSLHCLCEDCHKNAQDRKQLLERQLGRIDLADMDTLLGFAMGLEVQNYPMVVLDVFSYEVAVGIGRCWGLTAEEVIDALEEKTIDGWKLDELAKMKHKPS